MLKIKICPGQKNGKSWDLECNSSWLNSLELGEAPMKYSRMKDHKVTLQ
jgi:hypothetical protein